MHYFEKNNLKMNGFYIVYNAGSIYEENGKAGTMHLMEHLICKQLDDMQNEFTKRCINFNAYTWIHVWREKHIKENKDLHKRIKRLERIYGKAFS